MSWPALLRARWSFLLEELVRAVTLPEPEPDPVNSTNGLSDDPDPVGSTDEEDDEDRNRDGSKKGWNSSNASKPTDPFGGEVPKSQIQFPAP